MHKTDENNDIEKKQCMCIALQMVLVGSHYDR